MNKPPKAKVFVEGRYRKLVRDLPQTIFYCPDCKGHRRRRHGCERCDGFGKLTRESVQELVAWVAGKAFGTRKQKFHGAGREDIDVRMLGAGRPFVLELQDPKVFDVDLAEVEREINRRNEGRLEIEGLHWTEKTRVRALKETPHAKAYEAWIGAEGPPDPDAVRGLVGERLEVRQQTPGRVAHRRADLERERWVVVEELEPGRPDDAALAEPLDAGAWPGGVWRVRMRTQHGTYVKEVLHGDEGRTRPSLTERLGTPLSCLALDVLEILDEEGDAEPRPAPPPAFGAGL